MGYDVGDTFLEPAEPAPGDAPESIEIEPESTGPANLGDSMDAVAITLPRP